MGGRGSGSSQSTGTTWTRTLRTTPLGAQTAATGGATQRRHGGVHATSDESGERFGPEVPGKNRTMADVRAMSDTEFAKYMTSLKKSIGDSELDALNLDSSNKQNSYVNGPNSADFQRMVYDAGLNGRPNIVSRSEFGQLDGDTIYRAVQSSSRIPGDTMDVRANRIINGERFSTGRGWYGAGLYFGPSTNVKNYAGAPRGQNALVRAKLNGNAKSIDYYSLVSKMRSESPAIVKALGKSSSLYGSGNSGFKDEAFVSIYAAYKGYNVIRCSTGYVVLDRRALTVCDEAQVF